MDSSRGKIYREMRHWKSECENPKGDENLGTIWVTTGPDPSSLPWALFCLTPRGSSFHNITGLCSCLPPWIPPNYMLGREHCQGFHMSCKVQKLENAAVFHFPVSKGKSIIQILPVWEILPKMNTSFTWKRSFSMWWSEVSANQTMLH